MTNEITNPYVGLRPFEMDESLLFFGRNEQTMELLQRLHQHHFVAVVGSSGCGKSSLLRAGLIPSLKAGYLVDDSDHWFIAIMKPGQNPLYHLADNILRQVNTETSEDEIKKFAQTINEEGADAILALLKPLNKKHNTNFFLLVDQFEELFRFAMDQKDAARKDEAIDFVNIILELSQQKDIPVYVVITMRSDFIGDCAQFYGLPEAMNKSQYLVPKLSRIETKTVIEGPAKLFGGKFSPALTSRLLNDLGKVKDELPLLQHALMRMWDFEMTQDKSGEIDLKDYERIGGLEKTLSNHADEALNGMKEDEIKITKNIFQSLTTIDENGRKIRRPALLSHLAAITGAGKNDILRIINRFIEDKRSFLIINKTTDPDDPLIDISHESLIRQWNTLSQWVDEEGESASYYLQLAEAARLHKLQRKDYMHGSELQIALNWYNKYKPSATWANRYKTGFDETINYLLESEKDEIFITKKEKAGKKRQRLLTYGIATLLIFAGATTFGIYNVTKAKLKAEKAKFKAEHAEQIAIAESQKAQRKGKEAEIRRAIADEKTKEALKSDSFSKQQWLKADIEKQKQIEATREANRQKAFAEQARQLAIQNQQIALRQKRMADFQLSISEQQKGELVNKIKFLSSINDTITTAVKNLAKETNPSVIYDKLKQISQSFYTASGDKIEFELLSGDTRKAGSPELKPGQAIESKNKKYLLVFQKDGRLVVYKKNGMIARWDSGTFGANFAGMMKSGNFLVAFEQDDNEKTLDLMWQSDTKGHPNAYIVMQEDGNLVIYDDAGDHKNPIWASGSFDPNWQFDD